MNPLEFPHLTQYINDFSGVLLKERRKELNEFFARHEQQTSEQVVTVLFPHRQGRELLDIGLELFNANGIGQKNLNNGLLLIIATEEKKIRIITGKGMELKYTEMRCREIIENHLRPLLNDGKYEELIQAWNDIISGTTNVRTSMNYQEMESIIENKKYYGFIPATVIGIAFGIFLINDYLSGTIGIIIAIIFLYILKKNKSSISRRIYSFLLIGPIALILISVFAFFTPSVCTLERIGFDGNKHYSCTRDLLGHTYNYNITTGGASSSHSSYGGGGSHSSSFGGGGGSSNGGGYGD